MKSIVILSSLFITSYISINSSYAESKCYIPMRSLDLSVKAETKDVCKQKKMQPAAGTPKGSEETNEDTPVQMKGYFVRPEVENKEKATSADGLGVGVTVDF